MPDTIILETLACVAGQKRKAAEANLPDREDFEDEKSCEQKSAKSRPTLPVDLTREEQDEHAYQVFEHIWSLYLRPELEARYGISPPLPHISVLAQQLTQTQQLDDIPEPPLQRLEDVTPGRGLDEDDEECVPTQPYVDCVYVDCACVDCTIAATQTIDQFSDSE